MLSNTNFENYAIANRLSGNFYFFVHMNSDINNNFYYSNYHSLLDGYIPTKLNVSPAFFQANAREGSFSNRPVTVTMSNAIYPAANTITLRWTEIFANDEFETEICKIYIGYEGIDDTADLLPYYIGRIQNFRYDINQVSFDVVDRSFNEFPALPKDKISRGDYANISADLEDKPMPIIYGNFIFDGYGGGNGIETSSHYGFLTPIPLIIIENNLDQSTPELTLLTSDHNPTLATVQVLILDEDLNSLGVIEDTVTNNADGTFTISCFDHSAVDLLTATHYQYPDRYEVNIATITNPGNAIDFDYDTEATLGSQSQITIKFPGNMRINRDDLIPIWNDSSGESTIGINSVKIELAGYNDGTWSVGESLAVGIENTGYLDGIDHTAANALIDTNSFNIITLDNLQICYPKKQDGSTVMFQMDENSGGTLVNVVLDEGYYYLMEDVANAIDAKLKELTDSASLSNSYKFTYNKYKNRMQCIRTAGSVNFRCKDTGGNADDIGFTDVAPSYVTTGVFLGNSNTILDIPDGDLSLISIYIDPETASSNGEFYLKGVRLTIERAYRDWNYGAGPRGGRLIDLIGLSRGGEGKSIWELNININRFTQAQQNGGRVGNYDRKQSILNTIAGSKFYAQVDGYGSQDKGPDIIKSIISDYLGLSANLDTTSFTDASSDTQMANLCLYLAEEVNCSQVFADIAKYSGGFFHIGQDGKYKMDCIESSYSSGDVDKTIEYRDIKEPLSENLLISRVPIGDVRKSVVLNYAYNYALGKFGKSVTKTSSSTLNLEEDTINVNYVNAPDTAAVIATYLGGDGATYGRWGKMRRIVEITLLAPEYHLQELGDIIAFDSDFNNTSLDLNVFGTPFSGYYWMVIAKQYSIKEITLTLLEVG